MPIYNVHEMHSRSYDLDIRIVSNFFIYNCSWQRIAGADSTMQQTFTNALGSTPYTEEKVKEAINTLNNKRKERLLLVLDYIEDQGKYFAEEILRSV